MCGALTGTTTPAPSTPAAINSAEHMAASGQAPSTSNRKADAAKQAASAAAEVTAEGGERAVPVSVSQTEDAADDQVADLTTDPGAAQAAQKSSSSGGGGEGDAKGLSKKQFNKLFSQRTQSDQSTVTGTRAPFTLKTGEQVTLVRPRLETSQQFECNASRMPKSSPCSAAFWELPFLCGVEQLPLEAACHTRAAHAPELHARMCISANMRRSYMHTKRVYLFAHMTHAYRSFRIHVVSTCTWTCTVTICMSKVNAYTRKHSRTFACAHACFIPIHMPHACI
jgi:hypothetical protein